MNSLLINNLKIQLYLTHLLNIDQQQKRKRGRKARRWFVRSWIVQREQYGHSHQLLPHLQEHDLDSYRYNLRVDHAIFNEILQRITPRISRQDTNWRKALEPGLRLAITLRFMATGEAYKSMALNLYRLIIVFIVLLSSKTRFTIVIDPGISWYCCGRFVMLSFHHRSAFGRLSCYYLDCRTVFGQPRIPPCNEYNECHTTITVRTPIAIR
ncbi:hypothetical protein Pcinc_005079 [Petrolisthes cinctipes]|uniref:Uncharacterized protein n=1 Tax=Petrolisthes cinctipes TaxID=88211 RepID=A0AAE1GEA9_PETCI|nr:hypothetical protein Pcinc_005893 [Petrolisthes cinctipes]KAK3890997.1 hypothetical protein Pcinc_005079 [Petrolisthes cinctipes]